MPTTYDGAIQNLIDDFAKLPGIGPKGAQRIAFHLLSVDESEAQELAQAIVDMRDKVRFCDICGNVCENSPCPICADPRRDHTTICVVQEPKDIMSIERTHEYRGVYHVLGGAINPMANISPQDLNIAALVRRMQAAESDDAQDSITEVILALNPDIEGEATTTYLSRLLEPVGITITRLASGLPVGGDLEYADEVTLGRALAGRRSVTQ
ncbi:recombination protein RecR [Alloscardovia theropitheci]|uniref:Recombination protein RecR n=1 Tax=Alloscardovia theropitheci TaxID=2496842 RepID=A0A4R0QW37_9BIFI|nr:recombination mediator RecR [Alloscardovia theropitheci]TCD54537.1 recombination protein RecR [Alloscardovia theropitheci]